ncbi:MAG: NAD(P)-dependent alcohol dehydrogenase [Spirochaetales bacterium]|nr:NAD(P)-dependent alcohol dehydrogenase [Spirochaetales bacterium]
MDTMRAVVYTKYGPPDVLTIGRIAKPEPEHDEVRIQIYASSVTRSDLFVRGYTVPFPTCIFLRLAMGVLKPRNPVLGQTFAGIVDKTGPGVTRFRAGDRVAGLGGFSFGGYAEYTCMKETDSKHGCLAVLPHNLAFEDATSAAYGGLLAFQFMERGNIHKGDKVLIYGASGTSGAMAVQYAAHLGASVTGVCGPSNLEFVTSLGAESVLDYTNTEASAKLERYDFILDAVGKAKTSGLKKACRGALTPRGTYASIDDSPLLLDSGRLGRIFHLVETGAIKPATDRVYPIEQIVEAHRYVEKGHKRGNVAVRVFAGAEE